MIAECSLMDPAKLRRLSGVGFYKIKILQYNNNKSSTPKNTWWGTFSSIIVFFFASHRSGNVIYTIIRTAIKVAQAEQSKLNVLRRT